MLLARDDLFREWDGKTTLATASTLFDRPKQKPISRFVLLLVGATLAVVFGLTHIALDLEIDTGSKQLANLHEEHAKLQSDNDQIYVQLNRRVKLSNLEKVATSRLNMVTPETAQLVNGY